MFLGVIIMIRIIGKIIDSHSDIVISEHDSDV
jgi:hypothetical protein